MKCSEIIKILEEQSPKSYAEKWDNIGLLVGSNEKQIKNILITLDVTNEVINQAKTQNTDLIISHHPLIFSPLKSITDDTPTGAKLINLIKSDISCYALHTNFDISTMADQAAQKLGLTSTVPLTEYPHIPDNKKGLGKIGIIKTPQTVEQCAAQIKEKFDLQTLSIYGDPKALVTTISILPGSGKDGILPSIKKGANLLVTGDINHHQGLDAAEAGLNIIDAGHYALEIIMLPYLKNYLTQNLPSYINVQLSNQSSPVKII